MESRLTALALRGFKDGGMACYRLSIFPKAESGNSYQQDPEWRDIGLLLGFFD
jgi:hypothetical protein